MVHNEAPPCVQDTEDAPTVEDLQLRIEALEAGVRVLHAVLANHLAKDPFADPDRRTLDAAMAAIGIGAR